jgi:sugar lactone lactonase YvrE
MIEVVVDHRDRCGEGSIWDAAGRRLLWTDIPRDVVYEYVPEARRTRAICRGVNVSAIALGRDGRLIFGGAGGVGVWSEQSGYRPVISQDADGLPLAINDMIAGPTGGIYFGTVYWGAAGMERHGKLYFMKSGGGPVRVVDEGIELANGLGFSVDGKTLYFADSAARRVYAYDVDRTTGGLSGERVFAQFAREDGVPDGLTVDAQGRVWCAMWYGGQIVRLDGEGNVERRIAMPALQVSSVAFGGEALEEMYVTTAGEAWPSELAPDGYRADAPGQGGALYRVAAGVRGKREYVADIGGR